MRRSSVRHRQAAPTQPQVGTPAASARREWLVANHTEGSQRSALGVRRLPSSRVPTAAETADLRRSTRPDRRRTDQAPIGCRCSSAVRERSRPHGCDVCPACCTAGTRCRGVARLVNRRRRGRFVNRSQVNRSPRRRRTEPHLLGVRVRQSRCRARRERPHPHHRSSPQPAPAIHRRPASATTHKRRRVARPARVGLCGRRGQQTGRASTRLPSRCRSAEKR